MSATTISSYDGNITIAGDMTVDTDTLFIDSTNKRMGIGVSNPSIALEIDGGIKTTQLNLVGGGASAPIGVIAVWYGTTASIPSGWELCNGSTYSRSDGGGNITTPNLSNYFIRGASPTLNPGTTGGTNTVTLALGNLPTHNHSGKTSSPGTHNHTQRMAGLDDNNFSGPTGQRPGGDARGQSPRGGYYYVQNGRSQHSHAVQLGYTGGGGAFPIIPNYYSLAYIMKV